jgi:hypothetical protein
MIGSIRLRRLGALCSKLDAASRGESISSLTGNRTSKYYQIITSHSHEIAFPVIRSVNANNKRGLNIPCCVWFTLTLLVLGQILP